jgi:hypothetical protein
MIIPVRRLTLSLAFLALVASGCGGLSDDDRGPGADPGTADPSPTGTGGAGGTDHPTGADEVILRVDTTGGFVPPSFLVTHVPEFSLMGDGRIVVQGPQIEIYPGPALPNLLQVQASEEAVQAVLDVAREAGLFGPDRHYDNRCAADLPTTTFTLTAEGETHVISAYALGFGEVPEDGQCVDPADAPPRAALAELRNQLSLPASWLPEGSVGDEEPYPFEELRIYTAPANPTDDAEDLEPSFQEWPLEGSLSEFGRPIELPPSARCGTVTGAELDTLLTAARKATERTFWTSEDLSYQLLFRPLLPDETGCPTG